MIVCYMKKVFILVGIRFIVIFVCWSGVWMVRVWMMVSGV